MFHREIRGLANRLTSSGAEERAQAMREFERASEVDQLAIAQELCKRFPKTDAPELAALEASSNTLRLLNPWEEGRKRILSAKLFRQLAATRTAREAEARIASLLKPVGCLQELDSDEVRELEALAVTHPAVIPTLVERLNNKKFADPRCVLPEVLGAIGQERPEVAALVLPLLAHGKVKVVEATVRIVERMGDLGDHTAK